jgi:hypothetical protein
LIFSSSILWACGLSVVNSGFSSFYRCFPVCCDKSFGEAGGMIVWKRPLKVRPILDLLGAERAVVDNFR